MGAFIDIGCQPLTNKNSGNRGLEIGLNRSSSNALEALLDEVLQEKFTQIHDSIMECLSLDQISFAELDATDFNIAIKAVRNCIAERQNSTEWEAYQKVVWEEDIEPLVQQDERYQKD